MKKFIHYLPRVLSVIIVCFLAAFILEGFGPDFTWMDSLMHLVLTLVVLAITILAWKKPKIGGWIFIAIGILYLIMVFKNQFWGGLIISGVPLLTGILFLVDKVKTARVNT